MKKLTQYAVLVAAGIVGAYILGVANNKFGPFPGLAEDDE